jgi:hypothetical protein
MERETGIEPATSSLGSWRSTAELLPLRCKGYYLAFFCSVCLTASLSSLPNLRIALWYD